MNNNKILRFLPLLLALVMIIAFAFNGRFDSLLHKNKELINDNSIPRLSFQSLFEEKKFFDTKQMQDEGKRYVLHFFASWCGYCVQEHDELMKIKDKGLPIYAVAWQDDKDDLRAFLNTHGNPYKDVFIDPTGSMSAKLRLNGVPQTFVINEKGQVVFYRRGVFEIDELLKFFS